MKTRFALCVLACALVGASGCVIRTWAPDTRSVPEAFAVRGPGRVRVTLTDSSRVTLVEPSLVSDSVIGRIGRWYGASGRWMRIPIARVHRIDRYPVNVPLTVLATGVGGYSLFVGVIHLMCGRSACFDFGSGWLPPIDARSR